MAQRGEEIVRRFYAAVTSREIDAIVSLTDPDCVMDWSRSIGPTKGVFPGHEGIEAWMATIWDAFESFEIVPVEVLGSGDRLVVKTHVTGRGRGSGVPVEAHGATVFDLEKGTIRRMTLFQVEQDALEAAGLSGD